MDDSGNLISTQTFRNVNQRRRDARMSLTVNSVAGKAIISIETAAENLWSGTCSPARKFSDQFQHGGSILGHNKDSSRRRIGRRGAPVSAAVVPGNLHRVLHCWRREESFISRI